LGGATTNACNDQQSGSIGPAVRIKDRFIPRSLLIVLPNIEKRGYAGTLHVPDRGGLLGSGYESGAIGAERSAANALTR
jgi:hypothetical protein